MSERRIIALIPKNEWARNEAGFKMLDCSLTAISKYGDWRGWGSWTAFDYFMDWLLYGFGHKGQPEPPQEREEHQGASNRLYQVFNLETLLAYPHDYFGEILAENQYGRHLGFFPTPLEVCQLMALMTLGGSDARTKSVMDPCVGTGRMLLAASNHSYRLWLRDQSHRHQGHIGQRVFVCALAGEAVPISGCGAGGPGAKPGGE